MHSWGSASDIGTLNQWMDNLVHCVYSLIFFTTQNRETLPLRRFTVRSIPACQSRTANARRWKAEAKWRARSEPAVEAESETSAVCTESSHQKPLPS